MAIPYPAVASEEIKSSELNANFDYVFEIQSPVGSVVAWLKNYTNTPALPDNWVECNGQTLSDADSVYNGQTIPDLNGDNRFLRGNSTSGDTGGTENNNHQHNVATETRFFCSISGGSNETRLDVNMINPNSNNLIKTTNLDNRPPYYNIVWVMRVK
jgi:hypothetical protein